LEQRLGYPAVWAVMLGIVIFIYVWFRKKNWL